MDKGKMFFKVQAILSIFFGIFLIISIQNKLIGAVIGLKDIEPSINLLFGFFFLIAGILMYLTLIKEENNTNKSEK